MLGVSLDTGIQLASGPIVNAACLKSGDYISGFVGGHISPLYVTKTHKSYSSQIYIVEFEDGFFTATGRQGVLSYRRCVQLQNLKPDDIIVKANLEPAIVKAIKSSTRRALVVKIKTDPQIPFVANGLACINQ